MYAVRVLYDVPDRDAHIEKALEYCSEIMFALQVLIDGQNPYTIRAVLKSYSGYGRHFTSSSQKNRLVFL